MTCPALCLLEDFSTFNEMPRLLNNVYIFSNPSFINRVRAENPCREQDGPFLFSHSDLTIHHGLHVY